MNLETATLPDGRTVSCVNAYEVGFGWHEVMSADFSRHGLTLPVGGNFVDVGANIGLFCLRLRDLCPEARICALEPMPAAFAALRANAADMGGTVEIFNMALGSAPGKIEFEYCPGITALSSSEAGARKTLSDGLRTLLFGTGVSADIRAIIDRTGAQEMIDDEAFVEQLFRTEQITADIDRLDAVAERLAIGPIDLLKIDTEGQERAVLDGIGPDLWRNIRQLLVEIHRGEDELRTIRADLEKHGYCCSIESHPMSEGGAPVFHIYAHRG
ncbi:FkbM family methyltransferase [Roseibium salinum]|uniref:FkbM family methyltransferase n=1 Tax=Roseibium salinum TaxID=1604349 RepID=UPI0036154E88